MRSPFRGAGGGAAGVAALAVTAALVLAAGRAAAEAPFFYDDISTVSVYDSTFTPMNRHAGLLNLYVQGWTYPDAGNPRQGVLSQNWAAEFRGRWVAPLDPAQSLTIEVKGSSRDHVVSEDYFLRTEYMYQGLKVAMFPYAGMRVPEHGEFEVYGGLESMSYKLQDVFPGFQGDVPLGFRGWAELRYDLDASNPVLRLEALSHTLAGWGVPDLTVTGGLDTFFQEGAAPRWLFEAHAEYALTQGFGQLGVLAGYSLDMAHDGIQQFSLGGKVGLF